MTDPEDELPWPDPVPYLAEALAEEAALPERIGPYAIIGVLGDGGMGVVYRARQEHPARDVALKVLHPGCAGPSPARRFQREIQALARLEHRGIARLYEAGEDVRGGSRQPYFAMELVDGAPITRFAAERSLDLRARIRLLAEVCDAVEYAHAQGIVHRDLKPGNVLVTTAGEPRILDFGIARVATVDAEASLRTETGQILGTLGYMSPEQVSGDPRLVDSRSDVYALGAIGYELVTGRLPLDVRRKTLADAARAIRDDDPLPPSAFAAAAAGDLDAILASALDKEPARRYPTAALFADDLRRFLSDRPVLARPPGLRDTARRLLRKHRAAALALAAVLVTLALAAAVSVSFALHAARQQQLAELRAEQTERVAQFQSEMLEALDAESMGRGIARSYREQVAAGLERAAAEPGEQAQAPADVEASLAAFDSLTAGVSAADVTRRVLDEFLLAPAASTLERRSGDPPLVRARFHVALGTAYSSLALSESAVRHLRAALDLRILELGRDHVDVAEAMHALSIALVGNGEDRAAEPLVREALEIRRRHLGSADLLTISTACNLALCLRTLGDVEQAVALARETLELARAHRGRGDAVIAGTLQNLGLMLSEVGDRAGAESAQREALAIWREIGPDDAPRVALMATSMCNLARLLSVTGANPEVETLDREALQLATEHLGRDHPLWFGILRHLASSVRAAGRLAEAEALLRQAFDASTRLFGANHSETAATAVALALVLEARGDFAAAEPLLRDALRIQRDRFGARSEEVGATLGHLAANAQLRRDAVAAEAAYREAIAALREARGPSERGLGEVSHNYGTLLRALRRPADAEPVLREAVQILRETDGASPALGAALAALGRVIADQERHEEAEPLLAEAATMLAVAHGPVAERALLARVSLAATVAALGRGAEAVAVLEEVYAGATASESANARVADIAARELARLLERRDVEEPGEGHAEAAAAWRARQSELGKQSPGAPDRPEH